MYKFKVVGSDEVVEVDFQAMMEMDAAGYITLPDGREACRVRGPAVRCQPKDPSAVAPLMVSDAMGFPTSHFGEFEAHRKMHGFKSVEFLPDPQVPEFMQVHFHNRKERDRYIKSREMHDRNSRNGSGGVISPLLMQRAIDLVSRS